MNVRRPPGLIRNLRQASTVCGTHRLKARSDALRVIDRLEYIATGLLRAQMRAHRLRIVVFGKGAIRARGGCQLVVQSPRSRFAISQRPNGSPLAP